MKTIKPRKLGVLTRTFGDAEEAARRTRSGMGSFCAAAHSARFAAAAAAGRRASAEVHFLSAVPRGPALPFRSRVGFPRIIESRAGSASGSNVEMLMNSVERYAALSRGLREDPS